MQNAVARLKMIGLLNERYDHEILAGEHITEEIERHMRDSDIIVFLFSPDFIASTACMEEWEFADNLIEQGKALHRTAVILRDCAWSDVIGKDGPKLLPEDALPVVEHPYEDRAWTYVYNEIKRVCEKIRNSFDPKGDFIDQLLRTEFGHHEAIMLSDLYVFPRITQFDTAKMEPNYQTTEVKSIDEIMEHNYILIHGDEKSGKTSLARQMYIDLIGKQPVLYVDVEKDGLESNVRFFDRVYVQQFNGDFNLWYEQENKVLILDNSSVTARMFNFLEFARSQFENMVVFFPTDVFYRLFTDEKRFGDFAKFEINALSRTQQEELIRKRLSYFDLDEPVTDGMVDQFENEVDSIIIANRIVPRYPFYVLTILETKERYMPNNFSISSSAHCYQALIISKLIKSGISNSDGDINTAFNLLEQIAFENFKNRDKDVSYVFDREKFLSEYRRRFIIETSMVNRIMRNEEGVLNDQGRFTSEYVFYFFLGKYLSNHLRPDDDVITELCENSHREGEFLTLLFLLHHSDDVTLIDNILNKSMEVLGDLPVATLDSDETRRFRQIMIDVPTNILSDKPIQDERDLERSVLNDEVFPENEEWEFGNVIFRVLKYNKILAQVLKNRHGNLPRDDVKMIIDVIIDGGLRLVNALLKDEEEIRELTEAIYERNDDWDVTRIQWALEMLSFFWTMAHIGHIVNAVNIPEVRNAVDEVVEEAETAAYDVVGYVNALGSTNSFQNRELQKLRQVWRRNRDVFIRRIISLWTQKHLNTHYVEDSMEQSIHATLGIDHVPRVFRERQTGRSEHERE